MMKKLAYILIALVILSLAAGCSGPGETSEYWPTEGWRTSTPEKQDMDSAKLDEVMEYIERMDKRGMPINSVLVVRHGHIVLEEYPQPDYDQDTAGDIYSTTKSFASALIGIAVEEGFIDGTEQKMIDLFPERTIENLDSRKESVTLEHILTMKAGLEWNEWRYAYTDPRNDYIKARFSADPIQYVLDLPMMEEPGVRWNYNGGTSDLLSALITEATGYDTLGFAQEFLFGPLGISDVTWLQDDRHGIYYAGYGLHLTPRDMAKFGYLYLHNGTWDGEQIVPADFVAEAVKTHSSVSASRGYGYQSWWTYPQSGVYYAAGLFGQRIYVVPDLDLVVVFTSSMSVTDPEFWMREVLFDYIMAACE